MLEIGFNGVLQTIQKNNNWQIIRYITNMMSEAAGYLLILMMDFTYSKIYVKRLYKFC